MARDDDEDLYDEEFDFVDDDDVEEDDVDEDDDDASDVESEVVEEPSRVRSESRSRERSREQSDSRAAEDASDERQPDEGDEPVDEYGRPEQPPANYVVHLYENKKFTRTIERPFTPEDAETFASEFNRTSKNYGRFAVTGKNDAKPKKTLD
jgi:hypothetical protein